MNTDLANYLGRFHIEIEPISKTQKVKLLSRWSSEFSDLLMCARHRHRAAGVRVGNAADEQIRSHDTESFFVLPDDGSDMPSLRCNHNFVPDLSPLLTDTFTKCDEIVVVDYDFEWSCVLVNHGTAGVGRYYST